MTDVSYQLAAELGESGFPQGGSGSWVGDPAVVVMRSGDRVYVPTLSELIETCTERGDFRLQCSFAEPDLVRW